MANDKQYTNDSEKTRSDLIARAYHKGRLRVSEAVQLGNLLLAGARGAKDSRLRFTMELPPSNLHWLEEADTAPSLNERQETLDIIPD